MAERLRLALGLGRIRSRRELGRRPHRKQGTKEGEAKAGRRNRRKGHGKKIKGKYNSFHSRGGGATSVYHKGGVSIARVLNIQHGFRLSSRLIFVSRQRRIAESRAALDWLPLDYGLGRTPFRACFAACLLSEEQMDDGYYCN